MDESTLTAGQREALELVKNGENVFITGPGGTGKSYLMEYLIEWAEAQKLRVLTCAPTGMAAVRIGGCTLHRALRIGPSDPIEHHDAPRLDGRSAIWKCDILVIDEISMCRIDLFDYMTRCVKFMNAKRKRLGERPCQLVLVGDFYQLPPVLTQNDLPILEAMYGEGLNDGYCINTAPWDSWNLKTVELTEVVRQQDKHFVEALNKCRFGDKEGLSWIIEHSSPEPIQGAIKLYGRNAEVDEENAYRLSLIQQPSKVYKAESHGNVNMNSMTAPEEIELKVGARVMLLANQDDGVHVNGSMGYVHSMTDGYVRVLFDDGLFYDVARFTWEIKAPRADGDRIVVDIVGEYTQIPLKLAYAITIHKSQGQTFDAVELDPSCWEKGQLYTALSRLSNVAGLHFVQPCDPSYLKAPRFIRPNLEAVEFYTLIGRLAVAGHDLAMRGEDETLIREEIAKVLGGVHGRTAEGL